MKIHSFHYLIILIQENKASNFAMIYCPLCFSKPFFIFTKVGDTGALPSKKLKLRPLQLHNFDR